MYSLNSNKYNNFLFIHIPKCGGGTIKENLAKT